MKFNFYDDGSLSKKSIENRIARVLKRDYLALSKYEFKNCFDVFNNLKAKKFKIEIIVKEAK